MRPDAVSRAADALVLAAADEMAANLDQLTELLHERLTDQIEALRGDAVLQDLLGASIASNLEALVQVIRFGLPLPAPASPAAAAEYARRLAQRGTDPSALLRAYRLGHETSQLWALDRIVALAPSDRVALVATRRFVQLAFEYVDSVSTQVIAEYEGERVRWLANSNSVRSAMLRDLLAGKAVDVTRAENALGYRLRQHHLGVVLWLDREGTPDDLRTLEHLLARLAKDLGASGSGLFIAQDRSTGWAWLSLGRQAQTRAQVSDVLLEELTRSGASVALGGPAPGLEGFRSTNREARSAQELALMSPGGGRAVTSWQDPDVRTATLLLRDLDVTRRLVRSALGGLAADDEGTSWLRTTLRTYLAQEQSYAAAARMLNVHKNTVRYRLEKAAAVRGRPLDEDRLDLELALIACEWLGDAVLER